MVIPVRHLLRHALRMAAQVSLSMLICRLKDEYEKEVSTSFEVGAKMDFFDNRLRLNTAVFQTTVDDNQFFEFFAGAVWFDASSDHY